MNLLKTKTTPLRVINDGFEQRAFSELLIGVSLNFWEIKFCLVFLFFFFSLESYNDFRYKSLSNTICH
jgi:hypothetical protein